MNIDAEYEGNYAFICICDCMCECMYGYLSICMLYVCICMFLYINDDVNDIMNIDGEYERHCVESPFFLK